MLIQDQRQSLKRFNKFIIMSAKHSTTSLTMSFMAGTKCLTTAERNSLIQSKHVADTLKRKLRS